MSLSRRNMIKLSAGALLSANFWPGRLRAADAPASKPLRFIQVNDFHYAEDACAPFFEALIAKFNDLNPDLVLVVGDLVDGGTAGQCHAIHDILKSLKAPYYTTIGNHDALSATDHAPFDNVFGKNQNQTFETNGWQFIGLDTADFKKASGFDCHKETLDYVATLPGKLDKKKPTFLFTHFPLGPGVTNRLRNADALLEALKEFNLTAIFNGHYHAFTQTVANNTLATTNRCCSRKVGNHDKTWQKGFFLIEAADATYKRTFIEYGTDYPTSLTPTGPRPAAAANVPTSQPAY